MCVRAGRREQVGVVPTVAVASFPTGLCKTQQAFRHAVVREEAAVVVHADVVPQAEDATEGSAVGFAYRAELVEEETGGVDEGIAEVEVAHVGIQVGTCKMVFSSHPSRLGPDLGNGALGGGKTGIPCNRNASMRPDDAFAKFHESFRIGNVYFVGADVEIGAVCGRNFGEKFLQTCFQYLLSFFRGHAEAKGFVKILAVSGHVDFRDHADTPFSGVGDDFPDFVVGVEFPFVPTGSLELGIIQLGIGAAFDAPGGVVGQVPVEDIEFVEGQQVDFLFDPVNFAVIASGVVHEPPDRERGPIFDAKVGNEDAAEGPVVEPFRGCYARQLGQGCAAVRQSSLVAGLDEGRMPLHGQSIAFSG